MNLKRLFYCCVALCIFAVGRAQAAPKKLQVTRDNFVSLSWSVPSRADENRTLDYLVDRDSIALLPPRISGGFGGGFPPYNPPDVRPLSANQFEALVRALRLADVPALARQNAAALKPQETLTLVLSDENNADQTFALAFSAENRPAAYAKLRDFLAEFVLGKGLTEAAPTTPATAPE